MDGLDQIVKSDFLFDALHVLLRDLHNIDDLASENFVQFGFRIFLLLGFAHFTVLSNPEYFFNVDEVVSYFTNHGRLPLLFFLQRGG